MPSPEPEYQKSKTDRDLLPVVDQHDRVVGSAPRRMVHMQSLLHRAVHAVVVNGAGEVLLQLRSRTKDSHPGYWDISMGGHVDIGEEYPEAARRELAEELGIENSEFEEVARRDASAQSGWEFVRIYEVRCDGPFNPPADEIGELRWVAPEQLFREYTPDQSDPDRRITGSGLISLKAWAKARGIPC